MSPRWWRVRAAGVAVLLGVTLGAAPALAGAGVPQVAGVDCTGVQVPDARPVVLLVHGFTGSAAAWPKARSGGYTLTGEDMSGYYMTAFDYAPASRQWVNDPRSGPALAVRIHCLALASRSVHGPGMVLLVAHSLGALASQYALAQTVDGRKVSDDVGGLVALGAPWQGSFWLSSALVDTASFVIEQSCNLGWPVAGGSTAASSSPGSGYLPRQRRPASAFPSSPGAPPNAACAYLRNLDQNRVGSPAVQGFIPKSPLVGTPNPLMDTLNKDEPLPVSVPVLDLAGAVDPITYVFEQKRLLFTQTPQRTQLASGDNDLVVTIASATTPGGRKADSTVVHCPWDIRYPAVMPSCWHGPMPSTAAFAALVKAQLDRWRAAAQVPVAPPVQAWFNHTYQVKCPRLADSPVTVQVANKAGAAGKFQVRVGAVTQGELTGAPGKETAVLLLCQDTTLSPNVFADEVQVFDARGHLLGGPLQLPSPFVPTAQFSGVVKVPHFSGTPFTIAGATLQTGADYWTVSDLPGQPSVHRVLTWRWTGATFAPTGAPTEADLACRPGTPNSFTLGPVCLVPGGFTMARVSPGFAHGGVCVGGACPQLNVYAGAGYAELMQGGNVNGPFQMDAPDGWSIYGEMPCEGGSDPVPGASRLTSSGFAPFGPKKSLYRQWTVTCRDGSTQLVTAWLLPVTHVALVTAPMKPLSVGAVDVMVRGASFH